MVNATGVRDAEMAVKDFLRDLPHVTTRASELLQVSQTRADGPSNVARLRGVVCEKHARGLNYFLGDLGKDLNGRVENMDRGHVRDVVRR